MNKIIYQIALRSFTPEGTFEAATKLLEYVRLLPVKRSIVVIGQAGERDPFKRKVVGELLLNNSDHAILTYEDPRSEDINSIIDTLDVLAIEVINLSGKKLKR